MIFEKVTHHKGDTASLGHPYQALSLVDAQCQRLFDEEVFAGTDHAARQSEMRLGRRSDYHAVDRVVGEHLFRVDLGADCRKAGSNIVQ